MPEQDRAQQLDRIVDAILANPHAPLPASTDSGAELASLARIAAELRGLPRETFKERLISELD